MKEVALLLGELAENAPLQIGDINPGLLTTKQVIKTHFHVSIELNFFLQDKSDHSILVTLLW